MISLWQRTISFTNLYLAYRAAARGRHSRVSTASFEFNLEENLITLQEELSNKTYEPGQYTTFLIHDPKVRVISAAPFRDRVVHHALINTIEPLYEPKFIFDSYANRLGKGTHKALDRCTQFLRKYKYVLPLDIVQYFPSIDHQVLINNLQKSISDPDIIWLCKTIIEHGGSINHNNSPLGLPIGNQTSQFWANVYLNPLDHFIKRELKCKGYIRYVDDMLLFSDNKQDLWAWLKEISLFLSELKLQVHQSSAQPRPTLIGIPFLGFQVFQDHRRLKRQKVVHARRKFKLMMSKFYEGELSSCKVREKTIAWVNHARYGDTWGLRKDVLKTIRL